MGYLMAGRPQVGFEAKLLKPQVKVSRKDAKLAKAAKKIQGVQPIVHC
jgi:hypothetical protein